MEHFSIYHRKDGRYEGRIPLGKIDGKRKYKSFIGKDRAQVENKMRAYLSETHQNANNYLFSDVVSRWLKVKVLIVKESTASNYHMKVNKHILPYFWKKHTFQISTDDVYAFIEEKKNEGLSDRYIADILVLLKSIYKYAEVTYRIGNPMKNIVFNKKKASEIRLLDDAEQKQLEAYILSNQSLTTLGIALSKFMGIRIGELCALQWSDIDLEKRKLTVKKTLQRIQKHNGKHRTQLVITEPKSESSRREIPIPKSLISFLDRFKSDSRNYVLSGKSTPIEPRTMQYRFKNILNNVNLPSIHYHALRHMFASNCIRLGFDIKSLSEILGHGNTDITLNQYVHSGFELKKGYMDRLDSVI